MNAPLQPTGPANAARRPLWRLARTIVAGTVAGGLGTWGAAALWFCAPLPIVARGLIAGMYAGVLVTAFVRYRSPARRWRVVVGCFAVVWVWWLTISPSNDRDWSPDMAVLSHASVNGNSVTVHNVRHCDYRSTTDYDVRHEDVVYDLRTLRSVDLFLSVAGSGPIGHTMMSFGFDDGRYLCFSIEIRREKGERYSAVRGLFKQYELMYVVADECDVVRLRTNYRQETVYCYRLKADADLIRAALLDYLQSVNDMREHPRWYNSLTRNCTTSIRRHFLPYIRESPWDWRILANGYLDELLYERGVVSRDVSFDGLRARSRVNDRAMQAGKAPDFSDRIRQGLPVPHRG